MKNNIIIYVPIYDYEIYLFRIKNKGPGHKLSPKLAELIPEDLLEECYDNLPNQGVFGKCHWNDFLRRIVIITCTENFEDEVYADKISHEINHAVDEITRHLDIHDTEARSYLTGYIYKELRRKGFI